ncbi:MAG: NAD-dependent protein deacylase [Verrucomicrobia bacterium Tous-C9LFEB]|nr:MAG: NAD-dependent protein deacylase [Verrucomicrobia bacterium Tous-C9LFEB]
MSSTPKIVILTGAGISAESGLKTFRDADGLWENYSIEDVATPDGWQRNPKLVLDFYNQRRRDVLAAQPNAAHRACARLQDYFDTVVITQNIDDLHERAGSRNVLHLHGEIVKARSSVDPDCLVPMTGDIQFGDKCPRGSQLRPHVVWFGEAVPMMEEAAAEARTASQLIVVGTSLRVYPAASLVEFIRPGTPVTVIDPAPAMVSARNVTTLPGKASEMLPPFVEKLIAALGRT